MERLVSTAAWRSEFVRPSLHIVLWKIRSIWSLVCNVEYSFFLKFYSFFEPVLFFCPGRIIIKLTVKGGNCIEN